MSHNPPFANKLRPDLARDLANQLGPELTQQITNIGAQMSDVVRQQKDTLVNIQKHGCETIKLELKRAIAGVPEMIASNNNDDTYKRGQPFAVKKEFVELNNNTSRNMMHRCEVGEFYINTALSDTLNRGVVIMLDIHSYDKNKPDAFLCFTTLVKKPYL